MSIWDRKTLPAKALGAIRVLEGFKSLPYDDNGAASGGTWTIGFGSTRDADGRPVTAATPKVTEAEAEALLQRDMAHSVRSVDQAVRRRISEDEAAALILLAYNLGSLKVAAPSLLRFVEAGNKEGAARQFGAYIRSAGRAMLGLRRRRWFEAAVYLGMEPSEAHRKAWATIFTVEDWPPLPLHKADVVDLGEYRRSTLSADDLNERELRRIRGDDR